MSIKAPKAEQRYLTPAMRRWRAVTDVPLMALAVGSLPILLLEIKRDELARVDVLLIDAVNVLVLVAFAVDYLVELALAKDRRTYVRSEYLSLLIVLAQAIALLPSLAAFGILRSLRALRVLRAAAVLLRLIAIGGAASRDGARLIRRHGAAVGLAAATFTWVFSAAAFTVAEDVGDGARVHSFFDALWWSAATITTVGYGDIYPVTAAGRIVGGFTMVVGISTFAIVTAKVAQFLVLDDGVAEPDRADPQG